MSKIGLWAAGTLLAIIVLTAMPSAVVQPGTKCSDGTVWGQCSTVTPGMVCWADSGSPNGVSLLNVYDFPQSADVRSKCACSKFAGYTKVDNACVKTICTDPGNSQTLQSNACASTPPKQCVNGALVDNSALCGCPLGQKPSADGKKCDLRVGCRWNTIKCPSNQDCKYDQANANEDGTCVSKPGCAYNPTLCDSTQDCSTATNASGICVTKKGCTYDNPKCASDESCIGNGLGGICQKKSAGIPLANLTPTANATASSNPLAGISCCCLPSAGAAAMVGLVGYKSLKGRRKEEEE